MSEIVCKSCKSNNFKAVIIEKGNELTKVKLICSSCNKPYSSEVENE